MTNERDATAVFHRGAAVEWVEIDGEVVAYDAPRRALHRLNATAAQIWHACDGATAAGIAARLQRAYESDADVVARDVITTLQRLRDVGLVETRG